MEHIHYPLIFFLIAIVLGSTLYGTPKHEYFIADDKHKQSLEEKYKIDAYNNTKVRYHPTEEQLKEMYDFKQDTIDIITDSGHTKTIPYHKTQGTLLYHQPGSFPYKDWRMDYTDYMVLSRL
jgi:hypothetical protein